MKVQLNKDGVLIIKAENDIESYALSKWCNNYSKEDSKDGSLAIDTSIEENKILINYTDNIRSLCANAWQVGFDVGSNDSESLLVSTAEDWIKEKLK